MGGEEFKLGAMKSMLKVEDRAREIYLALEQNLNKTASNVTAAHGLYANDMHLV